MKKGMLSAYIGASLVTGAMPSAADQPASADRNVLELRQYKIVAGHRAEFIALFERNFVEPQEALGMRLIGQFRERDDPNRFVWLRAFNDMAHRAQQLQDFYNGPVWKAYRKQANPMLDDNDDVLLLRPAAPEDGFAASATKRATVGAKPAARGLVVAYIIYLWKDPAVGFAAFFDAKMKPELERAGLPVVGVFVPEAEPNNFPRLPVRQGEKLLVWFTRVADQGAYDRAWARLRQSAAWQNELGPAVADAQERSPQVLHLEATLRSVLR